MVVLHWHSKVGRSPACTDCCEKSMHSASRLLKGPWKSIKIQKEKGTRAGFFICISCHWTWRQSPNVSFKQAFVSWCAGYPLPRALGMSWSGAVLIEAAAPSFKGSLCGACFNGETQLYWRLLLLSWFPEVFDCKYSIELPDPWKRVGKKTWRDRNAANLACRS